MKMKKTEADWWKIIDAVHPKHRMAGQWHEMYEPKDPGRLLLGPKPQRLG